MFQDLCIAEKVFEPIKYWIGNFQFFSRESIDSIKYMLKIYLHICFKICVLPRKYLSQSNTKLETFNFPSTAIGLYCRAICTTHIHSHIHTIYPIHWNTFFCVEPHTFCTYEDICSTRIAVVDIMYHDTYYVLYA